MMCIIAWYCFILTMCTSLKAFKPWRKRLNQRYYEEMHDNEEKTFDDNIRGQGLLNMLQILQRINYSTQYEISWNVNYNAKILNYLADMKCSVIKFINYRVLNLTILWIYGCDKILYYYLMLRTYCTETAIRKWRWGKNSCLRQAQKRRSYVHTNVKYLHS